MRYNNTLDKQVKSVRNILRSKRVSNGPYDLLTDEVALRILGKPSDCFSIERVLGIDLASMKLEVAS